jgi:hypothetical protein
MKATVLTGAALAAALGVRVARSRHRRFLHPAGRSFTGELEVWGLAEPTGAALIDRPGRHPVTVRLSKGIGTDDGRPDVLGLAVRVHGRPMVDLLLSTAGRGRASRHLPMPRRGFDTFYGSILPYRTGAGHKVYLAAQPDPDAAPLGRTLESVAQAAARDDGRLMLSAADGAAGVFGQITFGAALTPVVDAALAFDPIRNVAEDLYPTGTVHGTRALAYRLSQRWRGVRPAAPAPAEVARTFSHR